MSLLVYFDVLYFVVLCPKDVVRALLILPVTKLGVILTGGSPFSPNPKKDEKNKFPSEK
jgi:hypothetical protein